MPGFMDAVRSLSPSPRRQAQGADVANSTTRASAQSTLTASEQQKFKEFMRDAEQALQAPDSDSTRRFCLALDQLSSLASGHADVQEAIAGFLGRACLRWPSDPGADPLVSAMARRYPPEQIDLSLVDPNRLDGLSMFLKAQLNRGDIHSALGLLSTPQSMSVLTFLERLQLPEQTKERLHQDMRAFAISSFEATAALEVKAQHGALNPADTHLLSSGICRRSLECIGDSAMSTRLAAELLGHPANHFNSNHWRDLTNHIVQRAPALSAAASVGCSRQLLNLYEQFPDPQLLWGGALALTRARELDALPPDLAAKVPFVVSALLTRAGYFRDGHEKTAHSLLCQAAVILADGQNAQAGVEFAKHCAKVTEFSPQGQPHELAEVAVLSFHLDSGDRPYFQIENAESTASRTEEIDYPPWLLAMREMLSDIWVDIGSPQHSRQHFEIVRSLHFAMGDGTDVMRVFQEYVTPQVALEVHQSAGPPIRSADWPALKEELLRRLPARGNWIDLRPVLPVQVPPTTNVE